MTSYEVLRAIFDGKTKRLADAWGVTVQSAAKFLRDPNDSGAPNPLDRFCKVVDEAVLANRPKSGLMHEYVKQHWRTAIGDQIRGAEWDAKRVASDILQSSARAVQTLAIKDTGAADQLQALIEARQILDEAISQLEILNGE